MAAEKSPADELIRGQRVDLSEVEEALRGVAGIDDAAVAVRENGQGRARLVAYIVCESEMTDKSNEISSHLRQLLTDAALPEIFVPLERLPRNAAGKLNRAALPEPGDGMESPVVEISTDDGMVANAVERIFTEALELRRIGHNENFFHLGGNSLMATVVITRLRRTFNVPIQMVRFFDNPTVAAVAAAIEECLLLEIKAMSEDDAIRLFGEDAAS